MIMRMEVIMMWKGIAIRRIWANVGIVGLGKNNDVAGVAIMAMISTFFIAATP